MKPLISGKFQVGEIQLMEELPNNHLGCIKKRWENNGISTTNLNWLAGFLIHQEYSSIWPDLELVFGGSSQFLSR